MDTKTVKIPKVLKKEDKYPEGANSATIVTTYECFCGSGTIVEENTVGFNDDFITIKCKKCLETYYDFVDKYGNDWKVYLRDK